MEAMACPRRRFGMGGSTFIRTICNASISKPAPAFTVSASLTSRAGFTLLFSRQTGKYTSLPPNPVLSSLRPGRASRCWPTIGLPGTSPSSTLPRPSAAIKCIFVATKRFTALENDRSRKVLAIQPLPSLNDEASALRLHLLGSSGIFVATI
jgi:hypothetical protein